MSRMPHARFVIFLALHLGVTVLALALGTDLPRALIAGFDVAALGFAGSLARIWWRDDPAAARARAARDDGGRLLLMLSAAVVIVVVLLALGQMLGASGRPGKAGIALVLATLLLAWLFANLVFAVHYAHLYHDPGSNGGIDLPGGETPVFADFAYFALTIGMTCQTADIAITGLPIRRVATLHALFAFAFNLGVLAMTVNLAASLL